MAKNDLVWQQLQAERGKVQLNEGIDHAYRIVVGNVVFEAGGQHRLLTPIFSFHKPAHASLPDGSVETWTDLLVSHSHGVNQTQQAWGAEAKFA
jgi:hypothetical protein